MTENADLARKPGLSPATRFRLLRAALYCVGFVPAVWLFYLGFSNQLGANPVRTLEQELGIWTLRFLIATLMVTPLRAFTGVSLLRYRRALGLLTFYYTLLHFATYVLIDYRLDLHAIGADIVKRPYITFGMLAFAILVPLAVTSNDWMVRRMGGAWPKLHRWVYLAAAAAAVHYLLVVKSWPMEPLVYVAILALLLAYRLAKWLRRRWRRRPAAA